MGGKLVTKGLKLNFEPQGTYIKTISILQAAVMEYRAPFAVNPLPGPVYYQPHNNNNNSAQNSTWKTSNQMVFESNARVAGMVVGCVAAGMAGAGGVLPAPLTDRFPVSTGLQHTQAKTSLFGGQQVWYVCGRVL